MLCLRSCTTHHAPDSDWRLRPDLLRIVDLAVVPRASERDDVVLVELRAILDEVVCGRDGVRVRFEGMLCFGSACVLRFARALRVRIKSVCWGTWGRCHGGRRDMGELEQRAGARGGYGKRRAEAVGVGGADERSRHDER